MGGLWSGRSAQPEWHPRPGAERLSRTPSTHGSVPSPPSGSLVPLCLESGRGGDDGLLVLLGRGSPLRTWAWLLSPERSSCCSRAPFWVSVSGAEGERRPAMAVPPGRASLGSGWPELLTDSLGQGPPPSGTHPLEKAGEPEAVCVSRASGMWMSDKSSSSFPLGRPGSRPITGERPRPGLWSPAVACGSAGWGLSRSRSERCPRSPPPFGQAASAGLGSGVAAHGQAPASSCPSSFRAEGRPPL